MLRTVGVTGKWTVTSLVLLCFSLAILGRAQADDILTLEDFTPDANSVANSVAAQVVLTYSAEIDAATVTTATVPVYGMQHGLLAATYAVDGETVRVTPPDDFFPGELVYVIATRATQDVTGTHLSQPTVWQFHTAGGSGGGEMEAGVTFGEGSTIQNASVGWADCDGDGDLDLAVGNYDRGDQSGELSAVYRNNGSGGFSERVPFGALTDDANVAWGDFNGDGAPDLAVGNYRRQNTVYINDGNCNFPLSVPFGTGNDYTYSVAWGDFEGDGDLDLAAGNYREQNQLYLNDGAGGFSGTVPFGTGRDDTTSVAWGDFNGDGYLDLAAGNTGANVIYFNDGNAGFTDPTPFGTGNDYTTDIAVGDFDGDGDLDVAVSNTRQQDLVYLNNGAGAFPASVPYGASDSEAHSLAAGDMNGDGRFDLAVGGYHVPVRVYLNDGAGGFGQPIEFGETTVTTEGLAWGDFDNDGDLDLAAANFGLHSVVFRNVAGQVSLFLPLIERQ